MPFPTASDEVTTQDWTQWMRWDDPKDPSDLSPSAFDFSSLASPNTSATSIEPQNLGGLSAADFSPVSNYSARPFSFRAAPSLETVGSTSPGARWSIAAASSTSSIRKRKTNSDDDDLASTVAQPGGLDLTPAAKGPSKKRAHNVIEKRYRANLNEKIAELRDSVPSLRASARQINGSGPDDEDTAEGVPAASKLNKASILAKATEYIRHLEIRNKRLEEENTALKIRLRQLDKAADQSVTSAASVSSPSNCTVSTESGASSSPSVFSNIEDPPSDGSPSHHNHHHHHHNNQQQQHHHQQQQQQQQNLQNHPPEGLIKVPDAFRQLRAAAKQGPYSESYIQYENPNNNSSSSSSSSGGTGRRSGARLPNKYMLGALAGLMVVEGLSSRDDESESTAKGLLAMPLNLIFPRQGLNIGEMPSLESLHALLRYYWSSWQARAISHVLLFAALVVGLAFIVFVYLFNAAPRRSSGDYVKAAVVGSGTGGASSSSSSSPLTPGNYRRQAWLTSIQQVGVPRHRFFREWYVVTSRCADYILRCLLGWKLYSYLTGITADDERGRVKTWDIAIDAQLAGGDPEISKSRLVLTIFAAGTLPRSPMRMMLKALHCRILLWRVGNPGAWTFACSNDVARALARYQWDLARRMNRSLPQGHPEALPPHLAALLEIDSDEVMIDAIVQRAANLTWNHPTQEGTDDDEVFLDVVEEDPAIQSSLDALAAWWSSHLLQRAILRYFEASSRDPDSRRSRVLFKAKIALALAIAPPTSAAYTRALVMKAVIFEHDRVQNIGAVLAALPSDKPKSSSSPSSSSSSKKDKDQPQSISNFLDSSLPVSVRDEISLAVRCAMIAAVFTARATGDDTSLPASFTVQRATAWFNQLPLDPVELTLLGFAAVYHLLHVLAADTDYLSSSDSSVPSTPSSEDGSTASSADDEAEEDNNKGQQPVRGIRGNHKNHRHLTIAPGSLPHLGRVTSELIYWARHAYNPAFYGFTSNLADVVEQECTSICDSLGVDVADYAAVQEERMKSKRRRDRKRSIVHSSSRKPGPLPSPNAAVAVTAATAVASPKHSKKTARRQSSGSNDTGYGSLSVEEDKS